MTFENNKEVSSTSHYSCDNCDGFDDNYDDDDNGNFDDNCDDDGNNDDNSIVSKLMIKCKNLLSKKKLYKLDISKMFKEFENLKNKFLKVTLSNEKLTKDLKAYTHLKCVFYLRKLRMKMKSF